MSQDIKTPTKNTEPQQKAKWQRVDLSSCPVELDAVSLIPENMARDLLVVALGLADNKIIVALADPADIDALNAVRAQTGREPEVMMASEREIEQAIARFYSLMREQQEAVKSHPKAAKAPAEHPKVERAIEEILHVDDLLTILMEKKGSDLHLCAGSAPALRVHGDLLTLSSYEMLSPSRAQQLLYAILTDEDISEFEQQHELDFAYSIPGLSRFRVNLHMQRGSVGAVFRSVPILPPDLDSLGMPPILKSLCHKPRGLVLVTGPTGSGKSTTLAGMIKEINEHRRCHIVTVEDPIEFLHNNKMSIVIQREVGSDTHSFANALKYVLRQDPDVIMIGEMRDLETIASAVTAAETGHLVFATLHTTSAAQSVDRIIDVFPPHQQNQIRLQLASVLEGILCQTLLPTIDEKGRACAQEILIATSAVRNLIREGKSHQLQSVLQSSAQVGMQTLDGALKNLVLKGQVAAEVAASMASNPEDFLSLLRMG
jgi:twitching motility protein PilT